MLRQQGRLRGNLYSGADDEEGSEDKAVVRTRTSSGDIVYNKDSAEDEDNEQSSSSEQSKYSLETQRIIYVFPVCRRDKFTGPTS